MAGETPDAASLAKFIDHTLLKPEAVDADFDKVCAEAVKYGFYSVCVASSRVAYIAPKLAGTGVKVCSVVGFPHGNMTSAAKAFETREAVKAGADEIDMVINVGWLRGGRLGDFEADIRAVREACGSPAPGSPAPDGSGVVLKVIIETCLLDEAEKIRACELARKAGADFVKTSTGFSTGGATVEDIALMRRVVGPTMGVKASGGIKTWKAAVAMIQAGATRIGAGSSVAIVTDQAAGTGY